MNKPYWEIKHDWFISDIKFELSLIWAVKKMLRQHPDGSIGDLLRKTIKLLKKCLAAEVKKYTEVYGDKPDVNSLRKEVESGKA